MSTSLTPEQRFFAKVTPAGPFECWMWTASTNRLGYGRFKIEYKTRAAHRWVYEFMHGEIPGDLVIDHLCGNKGCVNPFHLEPVTVRINTLRAYCANPWTHLMEPQNRASAPRRSHCHRGHELVGDNIYVGRDRGRRCATCIRARSLARSIKQAA